ncbi:MAG: hypothetical protein ACREJU_01400 [Nitrospiraceae bacterium]
MRTILTWLPLAGMVLITGSGCSPTTLGANTGMAYYHARDMQILNPAADENLDPVVGMEGPVAATAMETYRKGFEKPDAEFQKSVVTSGVQTK